jgi:hypothetical protein
MDLNSPHSDPEKELTESINKSQNEAEIKPLDKPGKSSANKVELAKEKPSDPPKNKIKPPKQELLHKEPRNKIEHPKITQNAKPKNKIAPLKQNTNQAPTNKIVRKFNPELTIRNKIQPHPKNPQPNTVKNGVIAQFDNKIQNPRIVYSEKDIRYWINQYEHYKSFKKVQDHLRNEGRRVPGISTLQNRIKELIGQEKYKELMKKYSFDDIRKIISQISKSKTGLPGKILSNPEEFQGVKSTLKFKCGTCNHQWETTVDAIIHNKSWCLKCAAKGRVNNQRGSIEEHQKIITQKGGKLVEIRYENPKEKLFNQRTRFKVECEAGHEFSINAHNLKQGKWCRECSYEIIGDKLRGSFQDIQNIIEKRGGKCLSKPEDYKNEHQKLTIQCNKEHIFERRTYNLKRGDWCPVCSQGIFEKISRGFFEEMFKSKFPEERPNWLINSRGNQMELDGYNKSIGLAFEAQGEQHYRAVIHFNQALEDLEQRTKDDLRKLELCKQNNVTLIQIPYYIPYSKMQQYIIRKYERLSNKKFKKIPKIDFNKFYNDHKDQNKMDNYL